VSTKPRKVSATPAARANPVDGRWRIVRGAVEVASFKSEELARAQWYSLRRSMAGRGTKLLRPNGTVADEY